MTCDWSSHQAIAFSTCFRRFSSLVQNDLVIVWASQIGDTPSVTYSLNGLIKLSALSASSWSDIDQPFHDIGSSSSPSTWPSFLTVGKISFSLLSPNVLISSPYHIYRMFLKYFVNILCKFHLGNLPNRDTAAGVGAGGGSRSTLQDSPSRNWRSETDFSAEVEHWRQV